MVSPELVGRITSLTLAVSIGLAVAYWPMAKSHLAKSQERAKKATIVNLVPANTSEQRK
jgi:hypothetical protein